MNPKFCDLHMVDLKRFEKDGKEWYSHKVEGTQNWCKGVSSVPNSTGSSRPIAQPTKPVETTKEPVEEKVDWYGKERVSVAQTSYKSSSEVVAALVNAGLVTTTEDAWTMMHENALKIFKRIFMLKNKDESVSLPF